ncbi:Uncharacterised protein [Vibrio cholerae]|nr:Uncharacterised protein [Vibrio cholerae]
MMSPSSFLFFAQARNEYLNTVRAEIERASRYHHRR